MSWPVKNVFDVSKEDTEFLKPRSFFSIHRVIPLKSAFRIFALVCEINITLRVMLTA